MQYSLRNYSCLLLGLLNRCFGVFLNVISSRAIVDFQTAGILKKLALIKHCVSLYSQIQVRVGESPPAPESPTCPSRTIRLAAKHLRGAALPGAAAERTQPHPPGLSSWGGHAKTPVLGQPTSRAGKCRGSPRPPSTGSLDGELAGKEVRAGGGGRCGQQHHLCPQKRRGRSLPPTHPGRSKARRGM